MTRALPGIASTEARVNARLLYNIVLVAGLCSHPLAAGATYLLGIDNTPASVVLRALTAGAALLSIPFSIGARRPALARYLLIAIGLFWLCYAARLVEATIISDVAPGHDRYEYWIWAVFGCAVPMFALALRPTSFDELDAAFPWIYGLFVVAGVLGTFGAPNEFGRLALVALNPISLGHVGVTICLLTIWALVYRGPLDWIRTAAMLAGGCVGLYLMVATGSRGPLVSFAAVMLFLMLVSRARQALVIVAVTAAIAVLVVGLSILLEHAFGFVSFTRLFGHDYQQDEDVSVRTMFYKEALDGILAHPLTGFAIEVPSHRAYPHNILLEVFMAVGVIAGGLFVAVVAALVVKGAVWFRRSPGQAWIVLVFLQALVGAQTSGALFKVTAFWICVGAMISLAGAGGSRTADDSRTRQVGPVDTAGPFGFTEGRNSPDIGAGNARQDL